MAEEIIDTCRYGYYMGMSLRIIDPVLRRQPRNQIRTRRNSPTFVKRMDLNFKLQLKCQHFQICEIEGNTNTTTLLSEHISSQHALATLELIPISIFKHGDRTLKRLLFLEFQMYRDIINIELVVDKIINHWVNKIEEDQENSCRVFRKIYPLEIVLELVVFETIRAIDQPQVTMIPTPNNGMKRMLNKAENKEIMDLDDDESLCCVICLEEIRKDEEGSETLVFRLPCSNMFHRRMYKQVVED
ncbi:putative zinc finger protein [Cucumis melo var. makuwa]|uniref:Zinc finger protein n=2 Tax=Cucumis melo TaxID=3656 RepID=A0A5D3E1H7_CUCMM|nr:putative zinc finger protein [Cucumis melo var. makuwa]TYK29618.1 putative zinc finger protein [Cucumis melo var. makuwa]